MGQNVSSLEYGKCRDLTHAPMPMQCFIRVKVNFKKKNCVLPIEKCSFLVLARNMITLQQLIIHCRSIICQVVAYRRLKTNKESFKLSALTVVAVAYERWPLTRGFKYSDLTWKLLVFWKTGHWGEVAAYKRWSQSGGSMYWDSTMFFFYFWS